MGELLELRHNEVAPSEHNLRGELGDVAELAQSIEGVGLLQPLIARRTDHGLVLVAGARRHAAIGLLIEAGRVKRTAKWPVRVLDDLDDAGVAAAMLVENLHRQDLTATEQMRGLLLLQRDHGWAPDQIEHATGIPKSTVKRRLSWAVLPDHVLAAVEAERITIGYADELAALPAELRRQLLDRGRIPTAYDISEARRQRDRHAEIRRITKVLVDHGHLVVDDDGLDNPGEQVAAVLEALDGEVAEIDARGGRGQVQQIRYPALAGMIADRIVDLTPGQLFKVTLGPYSIDVVMFAAVDTAAPPTTQHAAAGTDDDEDEDDGYDDELETDWERDYSAAVDANDRARREHREQKDAAKHAFVQETATATLTAWALSALIRGEDQDEDGNWYVPNTIKDLCGRADDTDEAFREWSHANAANLARTAAATIIDSYGNYVELPAPFHVEEPDPIPFPDRKDYDSSGMLLSAGDEPAPDETAA